MRIYIYILYEFISEKYEWSNDNSIIPSTWCCKITAVIIFWENIILKKRYEKR